MHYQMTAFHAESWTFDVIENNIVRTLYNVTRYNRIFNIRHKFAGNASVSFEIPSL